MIYLETTATLIQEAAAGIFRSAHAMPEDKLTWKPAPTSRSALELIQEIVQVTGWMTRILNHRGMPEIGDNPEEEARQEKEQWHTLAACEAEYQRRAPEFDAALRAFPEELLTQEVALLWGTDTWLHTIDYAYWNIRYHDGQIQYIQTLYGDTEMH